MSHELLPDWAVAIGVYTCEEHVPELPEVENTKERLRVAWAGRVLESVEVVDERADRTHNLASLEGLCVLEVRRRGKNLVAVFGVDGTESLMILHLGMTGRIVRDKPALRWRRVVWHFHGGDDWVLSDMRRLGGVEVAQELPVRLVALGPEPWPSLLRGPDLRNALNGTRRKIHAALLDQSVVAGVGNIVACEALWLAGIHPDQQSNMLTDGQLRRLAGALHRVCERVIEAERDQEILYVTEGARPEYFHVYGREGAPCRAASPVNDVADQPCVVPLLKTKSSGRPVFWCPRCQEQR